MLRIGLTGGIGSGKSTVARMFEVLDIPVYNADQQAKELMEKDPQLKTALLEHFGQEVFQNGHLNRKYLADRVFQNPEQLDLLNSLVHPVTLADARNWMDRQDKPFVLFEAALLFESGAQEFLDLVIGVSAPWNLRLQRTMHRDQMNREQVIARMNRQVKEEIKIRLCDVVLHNDEQQALLPQVLSLHAELVKRASSN
ncbi:MAG: dephospho-CoA kinase [Chitinophagaceae bacterium]